MKHQRAVCAGTFAMALVLSNFSLSAQETTGSILGTVKDPSGAAIAQAEVQASGTNLVRPESVKTDSAGTYRFAALPPGTYTLSVTAPGFSQLRETNLSLGAGKVLTVNLAPEVGRLTESVVVSGEAIKIDTALSAVSTEVNMDEMNRLPKGRNFDSLIALAPGARAEAKSGQYQIDGSSGSENTFYLDGVEATDIQGGRLLRSNQIPVEFVQQFQIKSSGFEAQYGGATGGVISAVVRSGSNGFHGQGFLYMADDGLNGRPRQSLRLDPNNDNIANYFQPSRDGYRLLNPGGIFSGPIIKDRLWFSVGFAPQIESYERAVTFLRDNSTKVFHEQDETDYLFSKIDYAPFSKLRIAATYIYSPFRSQGVLPSLQGTSSPTNDYRNQGSRTPNSIYSGSADYTPTSKLVISFRGGYNYENYKDYGIPRGTYFRFVSSSNGIAGVPSKYQASSGQFTPANQQTTIDENTRVNLSADVSYLADFHGQHNFRGGWSTNRLHNTVANSYPDGYFRIGWNLAYKGVTVPGTVKGTYGYVIDRSFLGTIGDVGSNNTGFYFQDNWRATRRLTLNLGVRFENEYVPSFSTDKTLPGHAIDFGWGSKIAPRIGGAYDVLGNGKFKVSAAYSKFYDTMKYSLPRGSFGGDVWTDFVYPLNDPDLSKLKPGAAPGTLFESVNWRIPSNDPSQHLLDPNLKPFSLHSYDAQAEYELNSKTVLSARYNHRAVDHIIEDIGSLLAAGETYFIGNPGYGIVAQPSTFAAGVPTTPKAKRDYNAIEFRAERRFSQGLLYSLSYTYSSLKGNYAGLANSDEASNGNNSRIAANNSRAFDLPWMSYDAKGKLIYGPLATDRPNTFKAYVSYSYKSKVGETSIAPFMQAYSGTPLTTEVTVIDAPQYPNNRGDLGRTPFFSQMNLLLFHEIQLPKLREGARAKFEANFTNLFNQATVTDKYVLYSHTNDGGIFDATTQAQIFKGYDYKAKVAADGLRVDPQFGMAAAYQGPRSIRFGVTLFF